jgi:hypothetical protein
MEPQSLDARYVDLQKLVRLLTNTFGAGNFEVDAQVRIQIPIQPQFSRPSRLTSQIQDGGDKIVLSVPRKLTKVRTRGFHLYRSQVG